MSTTIHFVGGPYDGHEMTADDPHVFVGPTLDVFTDRGNPHPFFIGKNPPTFHADDSMKTWCWHRYTKTDRRGVVHPTITFTYEATYDVKKITCPQHGGHYIVGDPLPLYAAPLCSLNDLEHVEKYEVVAPTKPKTVADVDAETQTTTQPSAESGT